MDKCFTKGVLVMKTCRVHKRLRHESNVQDKLYVQEEVAGSREPGPGQALPGLLNNKLLGFTSSKNLD